MPAQASAENLPVEASPSPKTAEQVLHPISHSRSPDSLGAHFPGLNYAFSDLIFLGCCPRGPFPGMSPEGALSSARSAAWANEGENGSTPDQQLLAGALGRSRGSRACPWGSMASHACVPARSGPPGRLGADGDCAEPDRGTLQVPRSCSPERGRASFGVTPVSPGRLPECPPPLLLALGGLLSGNPEHPMGWAP